MKILFSTGELEKVFTATNKIALQVAQELCKKNGDECILVGISTQSEPFVEMTGGVRLVHINSDSVFDKAQIKLERFIDRNSDKNRDGAKRSFMLCHPFCAVLLAIKYSGIFKKNLTARSYQHQLSRIISEEKPDKIVITYMPFDLAECVFEIENISCPIYLYQMDPWGLHRLPELAKDEAEHTRQELAIFKRAEHIFTTPILLRQYLQHSEYKHYTQKMTALDFPNIRKIPKNLEEQGVFDFDKSYTNLLFCGIIEDNYRSPEGFLKNLSTLFTSDKKVRFYFVGTNLSECLTRYQKEYSDFIFLHDFVSLDKAFATMHAADILVNISNNLDNQVPSKIFDYFSLGKPILNVQKIENCPSREYFDHYPLTYTFEDYNQASGCQIASFIHMAKGKRLEYDQVAQIFSCATIAYAAEKISEVLGG